MWTFSADLKHPHPLATFGLLQLFFPPSLFFALVIGRHLDGGGG